jgi:hypothetical protein
MVDDDDVVYVMHFCRNRRCKVGWLDVDKYNAQDYPPRWRYCARCEGEREDGKLRDACK